MHAKYTEEEVDKIMNLLDIDDGYDFRRIGKMYDIYEEVVKQRDELMEALDKLLKAYDSIAHGIPKIAVQDYALINEAPLKARQALAKAKGGE